MIDTIYHVANAPRLALLTDLHGRPFESVITSLRVHQPSLIAITGDVLYGAAPVDDRSPLESQEHVLPFLEACNSIAPTYLSLGNHEWMLNRTDLQLISSTGVTVLDNGWVETTVDGKDVVLAGLTSGYVTDYPAFRATTDGSVRYPHKEPHIRSEAAAKHEPDISWLPEFAAVPSYHVLLNHHPELWPMIREYNIDL